MDININIIDIEEGLLGSLISNSDSYIIFEKLQASDFSSEIHKQVYSVMLDIYNEHSIFDSLTLEAELIKKNLFNKLGGRDKILEMMDKAPFEISVDSYIEIIKEHSVKSKLKAGIQKISNEINRNYKDAIELIDFSQNVIFSIASEEKKDEIQSIALLIKDRHEKLRHYNETNIFEYKGIMTKFKAYDNITGGLHGSELLILAARPAVGKTAFALNMAVNVANQDKKVLLFSLEMNNEQLLNRIIAMETGIDAKKISTYKLTEQEALIYERKINDIEKMPLYVSGEASVTVLDIKNYARKFKAMYGLDFLVIDYLQLINSPNSNKSREQQVSEISRALKLLSKELNIPILALSQLSRGVENRAEKTPMLSDLRESGAIEQDADLVMFLHREDYYSKKEEGDDKKDSSDEKLVDLIIGKHRNGSTGVVKLLFNQKKQKFNDNVYVD